MTKIDITAHAEALAKCLFSPPDEIDMNAIAEAMTAVFDAGALAMREAAEKRMNDWSRWPANSDSNAIRAIDPASLREVMS